MCPSRNPFDCFVNLPFLYSLPLPFTSFILPHVYPEVLLVSTSATSSCVYVLVCLPNYDIPSHVSSLLEPVFVPLHVSSPIVNVYLMLTCGKTGRLKPKVYKATIIRLESKTFKKKV